MSKGVKNFYGRHDPLSSDDEYIVPYNGIIIPPSPPREVESEMSESEEATNACDKENSEVGKKRKISQLSSSSDDELPLSMVRGKGPLQDRSNLQDEDDVPLTFIARGLWRTEIKTKTQKTLGVRLPVKENLGLRMPPPTKQKSKPSSQAQTVKAPFSPLQVNANSSLLVSSPNSSPVARDLSQSEQSCGINQHSSSDTKWSSLNSQSIVVGTPITSPFAPAASSTPNNELMTTPVRCNSVIQTKKTKQSSINDKSVDSASHTNTTEGPFESIVFERDDTEPFHLEPSSSKEPGTQEKPSAAKRQLRYRNPASVQRTRQAVASDSSDTDGLLSSSSSDGEVEQEEIQPKQQKRSKKKDQLGDKYTWVEADLDGEELPQIAFEKIFNNRSEPVNYFEYFFDAEIISTILEETNRYSGQRHSEGITMDLTQNELKVFFGIWIFMGICRLPSYHDYWKGPTKVPLVAESMTLTRFMLIRSRLHLVDNEEIPEDNNDPLAKVRPLLEHMKIKCRALKQPVNTFSIDESIQPYKGCKAGALRQYIKNKPHKWGFKSFMLTSSSGVVFDFLIYSGGNTFQLEGVDEQPELGIGGNIVAHLCRSIQNPRLSAVCFDNYFTSIPTVNYLLNSMGLKSTGTIRADRTKGCPLPSDKDLMKLGRGSSSVRTCGNVAIVKWADNRCVTLASTWTGIEPQQDVRRWDRKIKKKVAVTCPKIVQNYNKYMGGVDLFDMLMHLYRMPSRSKRWTFPLTAYMVDVALVNAFLMYSHDQNIAVTEDPQLSSKEFRLKVVTSLLLSNSTKKRVGRPRLAEKIKYKAQIPKPSAEVRFDGLNHFPEYSDERRRCKNCKSGFATVICQKCQMHLCFVKKRNCFFEYHQDAENPDAEEDGETEEEEVTCDFP